MTSDVLQISRSFKHIRCRCSHAPGPGAVEGFGRKCHQCDCMMLLCKNHKAQTQGFWRSSFPAEMSETASADNVAIDLLGKFSSMQIKQLLQCIQPRSSILLCSTCKMMNHGQYLLSAEHSQLAEPLRNAREGAQLAPQSPAEGQGDEQKPQTEVGLLRPHCKNVSAMLPAGCTGHDMSAHNAFAPCILSMQKMHPRMRRAIVQCTHSKSQSQILKSTVRPR